MNPCGKIFAVLRSAYTTKARLLNGGSRESTVRWYVAPEGAQFFEGHHCMQPLSWSEGSTAPNPQGEVIGAARPWNNGATPACADGSLVWGDPSWFRDGVPTLLEEPWVPNACGLPDACPLPCKACVPYYNTPSTGWTFKDLESGVFWPITGASFFHDATNPADPLDFVDIEGFLGDCGDGPYNMERLVWNHPEGFSQLLCPVFNDTGLRLSIWRTMPGDPYPNRSFRLEQ